MRWMKWLSILAALVLIVSCFYPWVSIESRNLVVKGTNAAGTTFGKPGYLNILLSSAYIALMLIPQLWSRRINLIVAAINVAWTFRNFIILSRCEGGDCPQQHMAFYVYVVMACLMLLGALLTDTRKRKL